MQRYRGSSLAAVQAAFPDFEFLPWLFGESTQRNYFSKVVNRKRYLEWLLEKVGKRSLVELSADDFKDNAGGGLLKSFGDSPLDIINSVQSSSNSENNGLQSLKNRPKGFWVLSPPPPPLFSSLPFLSLSSLLYLILALLS